VLVPLGGRSLVRQAAWQNSAIRSVDLADDGQTLLCVASRPLQHEFPLTRQFLFSRHALSGTGRAETTAAFLPFPHPPGASVHEMRADLAAAPRRGLAALAVPLAGAYLWDSGTGRVASAIAPGSATAACRFLEEDRLEVRGDRERVSVVEDAAAANGRALRIRAGAQRCEVHARWTQLGDSSIEAGGAGDWVFVAVAKLRGGEPGVEWLEAGSWRPDAVSRRPIPEALVPRDAYHLFVLGWNPAGDDIESQFLSMLPGQDDEAELWIDRFILVPVEDVQKYKWTDSLRPLMFDREGSRLYGLVTTRRLHQWQLPDLRLSSCWDNTRAAESTGLGYLHALDAGTDMVFAGGRDGVVRAVAAGQLKHLWPACFGRIEAIRLNSDESWAVLGTELGGCRIARVPRGEPIAELAGHRGAVRAIALSPDDQWLATGDEEGMVRLWHRSGETFSLWLTLPFAAPIQTVRLTPDGRELVVLVQGETAVRVLARAELEDRLRKLGLGSGS
jgi:hypothetical protein